MWFRRKKYKYDYPVELKIYDEGEWMQAHDYACNHLYGQFDVEITTPEYDDIFYFELKSDAMAFKLRWG